jgi:hypothetical protein
MKVVDGAVELGDKFVAGVETISQVNGEIASCLVAITTTRAMKSTETRKPTAKKQKQWRQQVRVRTR